MTILREYQTQAKGKYNETEWRSSKTRSTAASSSTHSSKQAASSKQPEVHIPNTFLGPPGAPKKDMLFLGPQGAPIIRRFLVNNILFVLLIHFRYPLIDQKTQNLLGPQGAPKGNWKLFIRYASISIKIGSDCRYNLVLDFCQFNLSFWYYAEKLLKGSSK